MRDVWGDNVSPSPSLRKVSVIHFSRYARKMDHQKIWTCYAAKTLENTQQYADLRE
jgi:hypothetical protein